MMESPNCYFHLQEPNEIPRLYGAMQMTEAEVIQMAQQVIKKLGYNPSWLKNREAGCGTCENRAAECAESSSSLSYKMAKNRTGWAENGCRHAESLGFEFA